MEKRWLAVGMMVWAAASGSGAETEAQGALVLTGVVDGGLPGGLPKGVEVFAIADVADLSRYGLGIANNGDGSDGLEFVFPAGPVEAGRYLRVATAAASWEAVFGVPPDYVSGVVAVNGDDAVELYFDGVVVDVFGNPDGPAAGEGWYYGDSYAYRADETGPDPGGFDAKHWRFGSARQLGALDLSGHAVALRTVFGLYTARGGAGPLRLWLSVEPGRVREDGGPEALRFRVGSDHLPPGGLSVRLRAEGSGASRLQLPDEVALTEEFPIAEWRSGVLEDPGLGGNEEAVVWAEAPGAAPASAPVIIEDVTPRPEVILTEVFPDSSTGDPNRDGAANFDDEFVEVVNASGAELDIGGWSLWTFGSSSELVERHRFAEGTLLAAGGALVVFQGLMAGTPDWWFGGATAQAAQSGRLFLADEGDTVVLRDPWGVSVNALVYGPGEAVPGVSLIPGPGGGTAGVLRHDAIEESLGAAFSPGTRAAGVSYAGVPDRLAVELESAELAEPNDAGLPWETRGVVHRIGSSGFEEEVRVRLTVEDGEELEVEPAELVILAGDGAAEFLLRTAADDRPDGDAKAVGVTAEADGYLPGRAEVDVIDLQLDILRVELEPAEVREGEEAGWLRVTLHELIGGRPRLGGPEVELTFTGLEGTGIIVAGDLIVPAGEAGAEVAFWAEDDGLAQGDRMAEWIVLAPGYREASVTVWIRDALRAPEGVVINEILADPPGSRPEHLEGDANGDGVRDSSADEFVELVNGSQTAIDLSGWTISDGAALRHVFAEGTVLGPGLAVVVFGGGLPAPESGGAQLLTASTGRLGLNNGGDTVILMNREGAPVEEVSYGREGGSGQSLNRDPDVAGRVWVEHSWAEGGEGRLFSPGLRADGSPFGETEAGEDPLEQWTARWFPQGGPASLVNSDPDGDGLANLLEYALGLNPIEAQAGLSLDGFTEDGRIRARWRRGGEVPSGVDLWLEVSSDLTGGGWRALEEWEWEEALEEDPASGSEQVTRLLSVELGGQGAVFVRLAARRSASPG
ncbi:MAG TPA: lamin tail domain-containing protein [Verrucomicrobiales bacterium]|nr:lamin tail domain-containing protein [Verrucomicrobiales bacterium]